MNINEHAMSIGLKDGVFYDIILTSYGFFIKDYDVDHKLVLTPISDAEANRLTNECHKHFEKVKRVR